ncbi:MAG: DnaA regulatory inactivator Hda [Pseudomonadota bacterium]
MSEQLPLQLTLPEHSTLDDYIFGSNQALQNLLQQQREQRNQPLIYLTSSPGTGRTHLLLGQCHAAQMHGLQAACLPCTQHNQWHPALLQDLARLDLVALDDIHCLAGQADWETALFHLYNQARDQHCQLLISASAPARTLPFQLPDLISRLSTGVTYRLKSLNDLQHAQLLCQLAARYGLSLPAAVSHYLIQRYTRDTHQLVLLMQHLNQASLVARRPLTVPFVREQLTLLQE